MIHTGNSCLVEESLGKLWYFTLTEQQIIEYRWNDGKSWSAPVQVDGQPVRQFSVTIDKDNKIYLLAYNSSKQLIYYEWENEQWYQRLLYRVTSRFENISYLEVLSTHNHIHLFYYIENSLKRAQETLIHSYYMDNRWHSNVLMNFLTDQVVTPQLVQSDEKGNVFCIYTRRIQNQSRCYYIYYDNSHHVWSKPSILFQKPGISLDFNGQTDSFGHLHMVWVEEAGSDYYLNYREIDPTIKNTASGTICIQEGVDPVKNPCLHIGEDLLCLWIQDKKGMASKGDSFGHHWDKPQEIVSGDIQAYGKIRITLDGRARSKKEIGDGYPGFKWTLETLFFGSKPDLVKRRDVESIESMEQGYGNKEEADPDYRYSEEKNRHTFSKSMEDLNQKLNTFQSKMSKIEKRLDDFYTALYQLQDYTRQKDKSSFQIEAQIRKLTFELEQMRSMKAKATFSRSVSYEDGGAKTFSIKQVANSKNSYDYKENELLVEEQAEIPELVQEQVAKDSKMKQEQDTKDAHKMEQKQVVEAKRTPLKNLDTGSGKIQLGNVNILINPEEEPDES